jgi:hypothetical protein
LTTFIIATSPIAVSVGPVFGNCSAPMNGSVMLCTTMRPKCTAITAAAI